MMFRLNRPPQTSSKLVSRRHLLAAGMRLGIFVLALQTALFSNSAFAHREKTIFTTIQFNPRTSMLEVMHRTFAHDVEHTLGSTLRARGGIDNIEAQAWLALELSDAFTLWEADTETPMALEVIGAELEGEFFWIYQEVPIAAMPDVLRVRHLMLRNHWPDMSNFVNVKYGSDVVSALFEGSVNTLTVSSAQRE